MTVTQAEGSFPDRNITEQIDRAIAIKFKDQRYVTTETAELVAERATKWAKIAGTIIGIPAAIAVALLSFLGISTYFDIQRVAADIANVDEVLTEAEVLRREVATLEATLIDLTPRIANAISTLGILEGRVTEATLAAGQAIVAADQAAAIQAGLQATVDAVTAAVDVARLGAIDAETIARQAVVAADDAFLTANRAVVLQTDLAAEAARLILQVQDIGERLRPAPIDPTPAPGGDLPVLNVPTNTVIPPQLPQLDIAPAPTVPPTPLVAP